MDPQLSYLLQLPDETLLKYFLPNFSLADLTYVCSASSRINELCSDDYLWQIKVQREFPDALKDKPNDMLWYNYYFILSGAKLIPVYLGNNQIGNIYFTPWSSQLTMSRFFRDFGNIDIREPYYVTFADAGNYPYILIREPDNIVSTLSDKFENVSKAIITQS